MSGIGKYCAGHYTDNCGCNSNYASFHNEYVSACYPVQWNNRFSNLLNYHHSLCYHSGTYAT